MIRTLASILLILAATFNLPVSGQNLTMNPASGHYCSGSPGVQFQITNSVAGQTYKLRKQGQASDQATVNGTGGTVSFPGVFPFGTYSTIPATNSRTVVADPLPAIFTLFVSDKGVYCNYPSTPGVYIQTLTSQIGVDYILYHGSTPLDTLPGNGGNVWFGWFTATGSYSVIAEYPTTGCSRKSNTITISSSNPPVAGFNSTIINACSSTPVSFQSTSTGAGLRYKWTFDDPNSKTFNSDTLANPQHLFEAWGNGTQTFHVKLRVTNSSGCTDSIVHDVTVTQKPDATLQENLNQSNPDYPNTFSTCNATSTNTAGKFEFVNASTTLSTNTNYKIDWGDPLLTDINQATFNAPFPETYTTLGYDTITYTVNGQNGCNNTRKYFVFVGNSAPGGIQNPGNLIGTAPYCISFGIQPDSYINPPDTKFVFSWGDGSPDTVILQQDLPVSRFISHCYTTCSSTLKGDPPRYMFLATCTPKNPCVDGITSAGPIIISCKAESEFVSAGNVQLWGGNGGDTIVGCNDVSFINTTQNGFYITPPYNDFTTATESSWNFGDPASGANNTSTLPNPVHHFSQSGQWYNVRLISFTGTNSSFNSGRDTTNHLIYIQTPPVADFDLNISDTCAPVAQFTDQSFVGGWGLPIYKWRINPSAGWSNTTPDHAGDSTYHSPLFVFNAAGKYDVKLIVENSCGLSEKDTTVIKCEPPVASISPKDIYLCGPGPRSFAPAYNMNCDTTTISYLWNVTPATYAFSPGSTNKSKYPTINFNDYANYVVTATITNGCGSDTAVQNIHITQQITNNIISPTSPATGELCTGQSQSPLVISGTIPTGGNPPYTYQWQENLNCDNLPASWKNIVVGGDQATYTLNSGLQTTRCFRRIVNDKGDCDNISLPVTIVVNPGITDNTIATSQQICKNTAPSLLKGTLAHGGGSPTVTYEWQLSNDGIVFSTIPLASGQDYQPGILNATSYFRRGAISPPCPTDYSNVVTISVCDPISGNVISADQEICQGTAPAALTGTVSGACNTYSYQWEAADISEYPTFKLIPGAIAQGYSPPALNSKTYFHRIVSAQGSTCSADTSNEIIINTLPIPTVNIFGPNPPVSNGASILLTATVSGGTPPYSAPLWGPGAYLKPPINLLDSTRTVNLDASRIFNLDVKDSKGCSGTDQFSVVIDGSPLSVSVSSNPDTICPNGASHLHATATGGSGKYTYEWTSPGNIYPEKSDIDVNPNSTTIYTCKVTDSITYVSVSADITVVVSKIPLLTSPVTVSICSGNQLNYSPTSDVAGTTFIWTSTPDANTSGNTNKSAPGELLIGDYLNNSGSVDGLVTYRITPRGPAPTFCLGQPVDVFATVKPVVQITNSIMKQTVIAGFPSAPVTFTPNVPGAGVHWEYSGSTCGSFASPQLTEDLNETMPSQIINLLPGAPFSCTLNYSVIPYVLNASGDTCWGNAYTYQYLVNSEPNKYSLQCPTPFCSGQSDTISLQNSDFGIEYRLYRGSTFVSPMLQGNGSSLNWPGIATSGSYTVKATNPNNGQSATMNGMCQVVINPLPLTFILTTQNGEHCAPVTPLLSGSQPGINYMLINNGNINNPMQLKPGTGVSGFLVFDPVSDSGNYTVRAVNPATGCERDMLGSFHVDPEINQFTVSPGGVLCEGISLCLDGSEAGITYQLWLNNIPFGAEVEGDALGGSVCFSKPTIAGTYRIHAKNKVTDCEIFFDKSIVINPLPTVFVMSPAEGCPGTEITLDNCQSGIAYFLDFVPAKKDPVQKKSVISNPVYCTGGKISFGQVTDPGLYRIKAVNTTTNCISWMTGSTTIHPEPQAYNILPQGTACPPVIITLDNFDQNATYYLYRNGDTLVATDDASDNKIDFGSQTAPGIYTVRAQFVFAGNFECWNDMLGSLRIYPEAVKYTLLPAGPLCPPAKFFLNGSETGVSYTLWHDTYGARQVVTGTGSKLQFIAENEPGNYWVEAKTSNNCLIKMDGIVLVHPKKVYNILPSGLGLCEPAQIGLDGADKNSTYELLHSDGTSLIPPETYFATADGAFLFTNPQPAGSYIVKSINEFGCDTIMKGIATVHPQPTVDAGKINDPICSPPATTVLLSGIAYNYSSVKWTSPTNPTGSNFSDPNSLTPVYTFTEADKLNKIVTLTLTAQGNGICAGASNSSTITIHLQAPIVNAGIDQVVCENSDVILNGSVSGGTNTGVWSGGMGTFDDTNSLTTVYHPAAGETGTDVILTLTSTNASPCPDLSDNISIRILNPLFYGNAGSDQTICYGETPARLVAQLPSGGSDTLNLTYQWQFLTGSGNTWQNVSSDGDSRFFSPGPLTATTSFRLLQTDNYCSPHKTVTTNTVKITVYDQLKASIASADQTICYGETPVKLTSAEPLGGSGTINFSYQWQYSTDVDPWTNVPSAGNTLEYSPGLLQTTTYYRLLQTDNYCTLNKTVTTNTVTVKVHSQLQAGKTSANQVICYGETPTLLTVAEPSGGSGSSNFTYQWQFSTDGEISWANVPGGGNSLVYLTGPLSLSTSYRLQQTDPYCSPDDVVFTNPITVTVYNQLFTGTASTNQTICYGETPLTLSATKPTGGSGSFDYQWQFSTNSGTSWANVASGGTALDYSPPALLVTTLYRLRITDSYCPNQVLITNAVTITVHGQLTAGSVSPDQIICYGETPSLLSANLPDGGSGTFAYQWQISTNAGTSWADVSTSGTSLTYSPGSLTTTSLFRLLQTDTYCSPNQVVTTYAITITVNKKLAAGKAGADQSICYGETPAPLTATEPSGGSLQFAYQWQYSTDGEITWTDVASGGKSLNYSPPSLTLSTSYRLKQSDTYCSPYQVVYTNTVTLTVHNQLLAGIASGNQTICYGETPAMLSATLPTGGSGSFLYQWQLSVNGGTTWTNIASAGTSLTYSPASLVTTTLYRLQQTDTYCTPNQVVTSNAVTITVYKQLIAGTAGADQTICYKAVPAKLTGTDPTGGSGIYGYQWQLLSATGTWEDIDGATLLLYTPPALIASASYRLVQKDSYCNTNQQVITNVVTIHVQIPTAYAGPDETVCGLVPFALTHGAADFAVDYSWSTSGNGSFGNQYQLNSTYFPSPADMLAGSVVLTLTISDKCKNVVADEMTLTLSQQAVAFFSFNSPICTGQPVTFNDLSTAGSGSVAQWIWNFGDGSPLETINFPDNPIATHSYAKAGTFAVKLTAVNSYGCTDDFTTEVTLLPAPIANFQFQHPCENSLVTFTDASLSNGAGKVISWKWDFDDPLTGIDNTSTLKEPSHIFSEGNKTYNVSLTIVNYNNCSATIVKQVFIRNTPAVEFTNSKTCLNELVNFTPDSQTMNFDSISTWHWEFGDGTESNERDASHLYPATGTYAVTLHVIDIAGCEKFVSKNITISPPPIAHFNTGDLNCTGANVHFNELASTSTGYIVKWNWEFGDGSLQTILHPDNPNVDHIYINSGVYSASLSIESSEGCTAKVSYPLTVKQSPNANFEYTDPVAAGTPVQFTDLTQVYGGGALLSWNWDFGNTSSGADNTSTYQNPLHIFNLGGNYNVTLVARSINTCTNTVTKTIAIIAAPSVVFSADTVCEGLPTHFNDRTHINNGTIDRWYWNFGDGSATSSQKNPVHTFAASGIYLVKLRIYAMIEGILVPDSTTLQVEVKQGPVAGFTTGITCLGQETRFTNTSTSTGFAIASFGWLFNDPTTTLDISSAIEPTYTYPAAGYYTVKLIAINTGGCSDTAQNPVLVNKLPVPDFTLSNACAGNPVVIRDISQDGDAPVDTWLWNISGLGGFLQIDTVQNPVVSFTTAGTFDVSLTISDADGCQSTLNRKTTINASPQSNFSITGNYENEQGKVLFTNESQDATKFVWDFGNGTYSSNRDPVASYPVDGEYSVQLISYSSSNCPDTITKKYNQLFKGLYIPTAFSPNNPLSDVNVFKPTGMNLKTYKIEVFNKWGNLIWSSEELIDGKPAEGWDGKIQGELAPIGVYLWKASAVFKDDSVWQGQSVGNTKNLSDNTFGTVLLIK